MILKFYEAKNRGWFYVDDVKECIVSDNFHVIINQCGESCFEEHETDTGDTISCEIYPDNVFVTQVHPVPEGATPSDRRDCRGVAYETHSGENKLVFFNSKAFLLNGEGKTIERI